MTWALHRSPKTQQAQIALMPIIAPMAGAFLVQGLLGPIWPLITQQAARSLTAILSLVFGSSYLSYTRIGMKWGHSAAC